MSYYRPEMSAADKLFGQTELAAGRATLIKQTYMFLALSVASAVAGGYLGSTSPAVIGFFSGWLGWVVALIALNTLPMIAMACRNNPVLGTMALIGDGFVAGLVLAPILFIAQNFAPSVVPAALMMTGIVFCGVTLYVMSSRRVFSAPRGIMAGIFFSIIGVIAINMLLGGLPLLSLLIAGAIGIFGVFVLIYATSGVLNEPEVAGPIGGAVMLFAGLFNVFTAILRILMHFSSSD